MRKTLIPACIMAIFLLTLPVAISAQDFSLDSSFGTDGKVWNPEPPLGYYGIYHWPTARVLVMEDGKILHFSTTGLGIMITRYLPDGTIDSTFGNSVPGYYTGTFGNGSVYYSYNTSPIRSPETAVAAAALPGGKFLVVGTVTANATRMYALARYLSDGSPDPTFGHSGMVLTQLGSGNADLADMALQPDGKIVQAGTAILDSIKVFATVHYMPDGSLDNSFDEDGITYTPYGEKDAIAKAIAVQLDGKIVVAGEVQNVVYHDRYGYPTGPQYIVDGGLVRLNSNGSVDAGFGTGGWATLNTFEQTEHIGGMAIQPDGKIIVMGDDYYYGIYGIFVIRFNGDGTPDTSFGTSGRQHFTAGEEAIEASDIRIQEDGTVLITANDESIITSNDIQLFRIPSGGTLTYVRGYSYHTRAGFGPVSIEYGGSMAQQGDRLIIGALSMYRLYEDRVSPDAIKAFLIRVKSSSRLLPRNPVQYYQDNDGDGYGENNITTVSYTAPAGYVTTGGDCDDRDATVHPGATEVADGKDNDCNGLVDDVITYTPIPAKIEAEDYYQQSGTQVEGTTDVGGGQNVGYIDWGDWMDYNLAVPHSGEYQVFLRLASPSVTNPQFEIRLGDEVLAVVDISNTGGFQSWQTVRVPVTLPQGDQRIRLVSTGGGYWNINWLQFKTDTIAPDHYVLIPARIEAEAYAAQSGTQLEQTSDVGGGENVGYLDWGDWMDYPITVPLSGTYYVWFRIATPSVTHPQFVLKSDNTVLAVVDVPYTGGFQQWQTLGIPIPLQQGNQVIRIMSTGGGYWNINWLQFGYATPLTKVQGVQEQGTGTLEPLITGTRIYPNPVHGAFILEVTNEYKGPITADAVDISGRIVKRFALNKQAPGLRATLSLPGLPDGAYFIRVTMQGQSEIVKIIKE